MTFGQVCRAVPALLFCVLMTAAARAAAPDFDALGKSLLQIQVLDKGEYKGHGTGFYVSYDGKILTNFHVIEPVVRQKMQIEAKTNGPDKPGRRLELWQAWPEYDLALLVPADAFPGEAFKPLILAPNEPKQATQVWAFGFANDRHLGTSVTSGIVSGVRSVDDLRTMLPGLVATAAKDARWVQSDCTINPGNSGGPMLTDNGTVVGVNTFVALDGRNLYFSVTSTCVNRLLKDVPAKPVGFASFKAPPKTSISEAPSAPDGGITVPPLTISVFKPEKTTVSKPVATMARAFKDAVLRGCTACDGSGFVLDRVNDGFEGRGVDRRIVYRTIERDCRICENGYTASPMEAQLRLAENLARAVAGLEAETQKNETLQTALFDDIAYALSNDALTRHYVSDATDKQLKSKWIKPGVTLAGWHPRAVREMHGDRTRWVMRVGEKAYLVLYPIRTELPTQEIVFTGIVTDVIDHKDGRFIVAQGGVAHASSPEAVRAFREKKKRDDGVDQQKRPRE